jgi:hypothetical protein
MDESLSLVRKIRSHRIVDTELQDSVIRPEIIDTELQDYRLQYCWHRTNLTTYLVLLKEKQVDSVTLSDLL